MRALIDAIKSGNSEAVSDLLQASPTHVNTTIRFSGVSALMLALQCHRFDIAQQLINLGAEVNAVDIENVTALQIAAQLGQQDIVLQLIARGADVNAKDNLDNTALNLAVANGHTRTALDLLAVGANPQVTSRLSEPCLHKAIRCDAEELVAALMQKHAPVNQYNGKGETPLCLAATKGDVYSVRQLLAGGANAALTKKPGILPRDDDNKSPSEIAADQGHPELAALLYFHVPATFIDLTVVQDREKFSSVLKYFHAQRKLFCHHLKRIDVHAVQAHYQKIIQKYVALNGLDPAKAQRNNVLRVLMRMAQGDASIEDVQNADKKLGYLKRPEFARLYAALKSRAAVHGILVSPNAKETGGAVAMVDVVRNSSLWSDPNAAVAAPAEVDVKSSAHHGIR